MCTGDGRFDGQDKLEGEQRWFRGKPNYVLVRARDHQHVRSCQWVFVWHHDSSGRALVVRVTADAVGFKRYDKARRTIPVLPPSRARPR